jgi:hypothetical protein
MLWIVILNFLDYVWDYGCDLWTGCVVLW